MGLRDHALRRRREADGADLGGLFVAEGELVVIRALRAGLRCLSVLVSEPELRRVPADLPADVPVHVAAPAVAQAITGYHLHRGLLAAFARPPERTPAEVVAGAEGRVLVLEGVHNPTNLGAIVRSAVALGVGGLLLDPTSCDPLYRRASRVAMGEVFALPWARCGPLPAGLAPLAAAGVTTVALTPDPGATPIDEVERDRPLALVLGAEGDGLTTATLAAADVRARIPMAGEVDSLNVAAAAAVACWALRRR